MEIRLAQPGKLFSTSTPNFTVLGLSVAGISLALALAERGHAVEIYEIEQDVSLSEQFLVSGTAISALTLSGVDYEVAARRKLEASGIVLRDDFRFVKLDRGASEAAVEIRNRANGRTFSEVKQSTLVFAPNGVPEASPLLKKASFSRAFGFGLSLSARADAPFFRGKSVAVIGDTSWALQQACLAAQYAKHVTVLAEVPNIVASEQLWSEVRKRSVDLTRDIAPTDLLFNTAGELNGVACMEHGHEKRLIVDGIFLAPRILADWTLFSGKQPGRPSFDTANVVVCGICNSIDFDAHTLLSQDGLDTAARLS